MHFKNLKNWFLPVSICILLGFLSSCRKDKALTTGGEVVFSVDTLMFDTVFTAQGSATRKVKIYNPQKEKLNITSIRMRKGANSAYRLNINGIAGTEVKDVELAGQDSVWVFAAVTVDPTDENSPFVENDELVVTLNGKEFAIPFIAYGQNAYYIVDSVLQTQTWLTDKPYVIIRNALVDEGQTLTIPAGARVYVHQDSRLFVAGTLKINGTKTDSVVFQGDRLDPLVWIGDYIDLPGQWGGIYFLQQSYNNEINYAVFKNGGAPTANPFGEGNIQGATIQVDPDTVQSATPKLRLKNTVIRSSLGYGILAYKSSVTAENCRIVECGAECVAAFQGGKYNFTYCTIGTFGRQYLAHSDNISMALLNYYPISQSEYISGNLDATITNCIVYGSLENEALFLERSGATMAVTLNHNLLKVSEPFGSFVVDNNNIKNQDPMYVDQAKDDYHLQAGSPAASAGVVIPSISSDLDGMPRGTSPSIGCFQVQ